MPGAEGIGNTLVSRLVCAHHNFFFFAFSSSLCIAWWPLHPTYKTTFWKSNILCRWSCYMEQLTCHRVSDLRHRLQDTFVSVIVLCLAT